MNRTTLTLLALLSLFTFSLTGCGGSGDTQVIEPPADDRAGVSEADANAYQEAMKQQGQQGPGN